MPVITLRQNSFITLFNEVSITGKLTQAQYLGLLSTTVSDEQEQRLIQRLLYAVRRRRIAVEGNFSAVA